LGKKVPKAANLKESKEGVGKKGWKKNTGSEASQSSYNAVNGRNKKKTTSQLERNEKQKKMNMKKKSGKLFGEKKNTGGEGKVEGEAETGRDGTSM